jgi:ABC-2 type transport system permease protein
VLALFKKEINSFFSSLTGYIVIITFLLVNSIFFWIWPGSVLDKGYAEMLILFENAPYVFLLLIPAVTMRSFAEEKNSGNIESLITKPISEIRIIMAKYLASLVLVAIAILPTFTYYISLYFTGNPMGNIDTGSVMGSYMGLVMLGSIYVAIGLFCSSLTENQIVALILSIVLCFLMTEVFNWLGGLFGAYDLFIFELGILPHYVSISRGVVDTRDVVYFLSVNGFFLLCTKTVLQKRKW